MENTNLLIMLTQNPIMSILMVRIIVAINLQPFHFSFLKVVEIVWSFSKCPQNLTFHIFHLTHQNGMNQSSMFQKKLDKKVYFL